jgi:hypothetical protein
MISNWKVTPSLLAMVFFVVYHWQVLAPSVKSTFFELDTSFVSKAYFLLLLLIYVILYITNGKSAVTDSVRNFSRSDAYGSISLLLVSWALIFMFIQGVSWGDFFVDRVGFVRSSDYQWAFGALVPLSMVVALRGLILFLYKKRPLALFMYLVPTIFVFFSGFRATGVVTLVGIFLYYIIFCKQYRVFSFGTLIVFFGASSAAILISYTRLLQMPFLEIESYDLYGKFSSASSFLLTGELGQISQNFVIGFGGNLSCNGYSFLQAIGQQVPWLGSYYSGGGFGRYSICMNGYYGDLVSAKSGNNIFAEFFYVFGYIGPLIAVGVQVLIINVLVGMLKKSQSLLQHSACTLLLSWTVFYYYRSDFSLTVGVVKLVIYLFLFTALANLIFRRKIE